MSFTPIPMASMPNSHDNIFVYGPPGCGKTLFAGGSQKRRMFYLNAENGYKTLKTWPGDAYGYYPKARLDLIVSTPIIKSMAEFVSAYQYLCANYRSFDLVVLDTATELAKTFMSDHLKKRNKILAEIQDWGVILGQLEWIFREIRALPMTKIVLAHENVKLNQATGFNTYGPQFQGAIRFDYAKHFDEIWRMTLVQQQVRDAAGNPTLLDHRLVQTSPDQNTEAKTRSNVLHPRELPQLDAMLDRMQGIA
jgi:hypothetical protein